MEQILHRPHLSIECRHRNHIWAATGSNSRSQELAVTARAQNGTVPRRPHPLSKSKRKLRLIHPKVIVSSLPIFCTTLSYRYPVSGRL